MGISRYIEEAGNIKVVIEGSNGRELLEKIIAAPVAPDICIIDINMPEMDGFQLLTEIKHRWPSMGCLIITQYDHESYISEMFRNGANGYLVKGGTPEEMITAINTIVQTGIFHTELSLHAEKSRGIKLADRELEFLRYACTELSYADIAQRMQTTFKTIDGIRERLCVKLGVKTRHGMLLAAITMGLHVIESKQTKIKRI